MKQSKKIIINSNKTVGVAEKLGCCRKNLQRKGFDVDSKHGKLAEN